MARIWSVVFTVEGSGEFPLDMLRYDECFPMDTQGVEAIAVRYSDYDNDQTRDALKRRRVTLCSVGGLSHSRPTTGRWESFGWRVVERDMQ